MDTHAIASNAADADAAAAMERHHAAMAGALSALVERLLVATAAAESGAVATARGELGDWLRRELLPHAAAEEESLYPTAQASEAGRLLVAGMLREHQTIANLVDEVEHAKEPVRAAASAKALEVMFESHLTKENELVLPLVVSIADASLAELLAGMHELLGDDARGAATPGDVRSQHVGHEGGCSCGESDDAAYPELDARAVPHAIRHATIFGALDALRIGGGMVLIAPHDPLPLLAQLEQRSPGAFEVSYLERSPQAFRLLFVRRNP